MGSAGKPSQPDSGGDGGTSSMGDAGGPPGDPGMPEAGAPMDGTAGAPGSGEVTQPDYPFDLNAAATALGGTLDPQREALDEKTVAYTLLGAGSSAALERTEWSTAAEAEFECSRAASGGTLVVGPDRMLFVASSADFLSFGTACTAIRVTTSAGYSATLTRSFAQAVLGAP